MTIGNMLIRPLLKANHGISLSKLQGAELEDVLEDEAQTLGDIHRQTATASYLKAVQDLKHDAWAEAAENIRKEMKDAYEKASAAP